VSKMVLCFIIVRVNCSSLSMIVIKNVYYYYYNFVTIVNQNFWQTYFTGILHQENQ